MEKEMRMACYRGSAFGLAIGSVIAGLISTNKYVIIMFAVLAFVSAIAYLFLTTFDQY